VNELSKLIFIFTKNGRNCGKAINLDISDFTNGRHKNNWLAYRLFRSTLPHSTILNMKGSGKLHVHSPASNKALL
jgi:hypothetical protein